jgi:hypothetical protein
VDSLGKTTVLLPWSTAETFTAVKTEQPLLYMGEGFFWGLRSISPTGFLFLPQEVALWFDAIYNNFYGRLINIHTQNCAFHSMSIETKLLVYF